MLGANVCSCRHLLLADEVAKERACSAAYLQGEMFSDFLKLEAVIGGYLRYTLPISAAGSVSI
jgi:hypothetical protein